MYAVREKGMSCLERDERLSGKRSTFLTAKKTSFQTQGGGWLPGLSFTLGHFIQQRRQLSVVNDAGNVVQKRNALAVSNRERSRVENAGRGVRQECSVNVLRGETCLFLFHA